MRDSQFGDLFGRFAYRAQETLDWLPTRLTALSFAIMGDFEDAVYCWRAQAQAWGHYAYGILLASAAGALRASSWATRCARTTPSSSALNWAWATTPTRAT